MANSNILLSRPNLIALDTSHWVGLMRDAKSQDTATRYAAKNFAHSLLERGYCVILTMHHMAELLAIADPDLAYERVAFLRALPNVAWISFGENEPVLGGITDILAAEALCAYQGAETPADIRAKASPLLVQFGSGEKAIDDNPVLIDIISAWARKDADHSRTIAGIIPINMLDSSKTLRSLLQGRLRSSDEASAQFSSIHRIVRTELETRGDKRIDDANERAAAFVQEAMDMRSVLPGEMQQMVFAALKIQGIDDDEIQLDMTIGEVGDLGLFRQQLRTVLAKTKEDFDVIKRRVREDQLPSRIVQKAVRKHAQDLSERKGSDVNDGHLLSLAPYVDVLYVDKRTAENVRRAVGKQPELKHLMGDVRKAPNWSGILDTLSQC